MNETALAELHYALLLKDAGCSSNAARVSQMFGTDDHVVKQRFKVVDGHDTIRLAIETLKLSGVGQSLWSRMRYFLGVAQRPDMTRELIQVRCDRGADIARRLGFPEGTALAIRSLDEHWNGMGYPDGKRGVEIPLHSRILNLAQTIEVFFATEGERGVKRILPERRGTWFDPTLVREALSWMGDRAWWDALRDADVVQRVAELEPPRFVRQVDELGLDEVAQAFAEIIDAKSPFTFRHSSEVARYACGIAGQLGYDENATRRMKRAGLLHDIGKVGVSNRILDKNGPLEPDERREVERHPLYSWEILSRVRAFEDFARLASVHHEKLDGSGYPWGLRAEELDQSARALVVADIWEALTADRPYRTGMPHAKAMGILESERGTKLDGACIDALGSYLEKEAGDL